MQNEKEIKSLQVPQVQIDLECACSNRLGIFHPAFVYKKLKSMIMIYPRHTPLSGVPQTWSTYTETFINQKELQK